MVLCFSVGLGGSGYWIGLTGWGHITFGLLDPPKSYAYLEATPHNLLDLILRVGVRRTLYAHSYLLQLLDLSKKIKGAFHFNVLRPERYASR